jgi:hypothetical protein
MRIPKNYIKIALIFIIGLLAVLLIAGGIAFAKRESLLNAV